MIEVTRAKAGDTRASHGCTQRAVKVPAPLRDAGLMALHDIHFSINGSTRWQLGPGELQLACIISGMLNYTDSLGHNDTVLGGEVQLLQPATAMEATPANGSAIDDLHCVVIRVRVPVTSAGNFGQRYFSDDSRRGHLCRLAAPGAEREAMALPVAMTVYGCELDAGNSVIHATGKDAGSLLYLARGEVLVDGQRMEAGDSAYFAPATPPTRIEAALDAELLVVALRQATTG